MSVPYYITSVPPRQSPRAESSFPMQAVQLAAFGEPLKRVLPQPLVHGDGDAVGEIERTRRLAHGNAHAFLGVLYEQFLVEPARLFAEYEVIPLAKFRLRIGAARLRREKVKAGVLRAGGEERLGVLVHDDADQMPIIQPRAAEIFIGNFKAQGLYKVERAARRRAGARDIARILRDFGFYENDMKHIPLGCLS